MYHMSLAFIQKLKLYQQRCKYNHTIRVSSDQSRHTINLNYTHRPSRKQTLSKVNSVRSIAKKLKDSLSKNSIKNIKEQPQSQLY